MNSFDCIIEKPSYKEEKDANAGERDDPSSLPRIAEPWFLTFNARMEFRIAMTLEDVKKAGLEDLGKSWG